MEALVFLLIIILFIGAILGGKSFGDTFRKGCGCGIVLFILTILMIMFFMSNPFQVQEINQNETNTYFHVKSDCNIYAKPDKNSEIIDYAFAGDKVYILKPNKYNYFYELENEDESKGYILKGKVEVVD